MRKKKLRKKNKKKKKMKKINLNTKLKYFKKHKILTNFNYI